VLHRIGQAPWKNKENAKKCNFLSLTVYGAQGWLNICIPYANFLKPEHPCVAPPTVSCSDSICSGSPDHLQNANGIFGKAANKLHIY